MSILRYLRKRKNTAQVAKDRLSIIISHERSQRDAPDFLPQLQSELVDVIAKYIDIDKEHVKVQMDRVGGNAVLELNVTLPEQEAEAAEA